MRRWFSKQIEVDFAASGGLRDLFVPGTTRTEVGMQAIRDQVLDGPGNRCVHDFIDLGLWIVGVMQDCAINCSVQVPTNRCSIHESILHLIYVIAGKLY